MTDSQHVTVNVHNPIVEQVHRLVDVDDTVVVTLGNGTLHGSVDLFVTENSWQAMRSAVDAFFAGEKNIADRLCGCGAYGDHDESQRTMNDSDSLACPYPDCLRYIDHHGPHEFSWGDSIPWPPEADWNEK